MADPITIAHPAISTALTPSQWKTPVIAVDVADSHNQRDIDAAMLESLMLKSGGTLAMMKSATAEYEELGKIKSVAEYRAWVSAFKRREQMALATFAAVGSSSGLTHFEIDSSEASQILELKGLMERWIERLIAGPSTYIAAYAQDDIETLRNVTALVQQQRETQQNTRLLRPESDAKKQKISKNDHEEEQLHVPFSMLELMADARAAGGDASKHSQSQSQKQSRMMKRLRMMKNYHDSAVESDDEDLSTTLESAVDTVSTTLESRVHLRQRLNRAYDMLEVPFRCQQCAGQGCDYCEYVGVTASWSYGSVINDRVNQD